MQIVRVIDVWGIIVISRLLCMSLFECPTDMEQRDGRIWRQGNENPQVQIYRYVTDRSFDSYLYQMFERLVEMFTPILTGDIGYQKYTAEGDSKITQIGRKVKEHET